MKFIITFLYCIIIASAYSAVFKKKFEESLAPAFFLHIAFMLICGVLGHVSIGMFGGIIISFGILLFYSLNQVKTSGSLTPPH